jgi:glycosidase
MPTFEFHVLRQARDTYNLEDTFFSIRGNVIFGGYVEAQRFAAQVNAKRSTEAAVQASQLNAMGLLHEILHFVISKYQEETNPNAFVNLFANLNAVHSESEMDKLLVAFAETFPVSSVYSGQQTPVQYLNGQSNGVSNRKIVMEELILVWLENRNPGFSPIGDLIDDKPLAAQTAYKEVLESVKTFFKGQPTFGPSGQSLIDLLMEPAFVSGSVTDQLAYILEKWRFVIGKSKFATRLLTGMDFLKEEGKYFLMLQQAQADRSITPSVVQAPFFGWGDKESPPVPEFKGPQYDYEPEKFSPDLNWMPRVVLIAKSTFVWLDQLSKTYQRHISRLDEIPDEELDVLAHRGFTGLWLIGLWERSKASQRIKQLNGNPEAVASAYSLMDYEIAAELGGNAGYENLRDRCKARGIRLASDMVPNHMGIDSTWVVNHPEYFIQASVPPYPNYTFNGPDLSNDNRVGIFIEDGYWRKTDAAVVFKRLDRWTGDVKYIYHGNDGTRMPWNDTAQLNFIKQDVREAVIQTILHVARLFPIIRFDAAMTLAKRHHARLWYPQPGTGGDIASRVAYAMSKEQFDELFPTEFWREVVDRVAVEVPDTLLLAEAFWMMEGFFVRTLGMHRVYNSAFMHMFKKEENAKYRESIKNVLEFNPQILKRYVNFMNNPDEETAVYQFGKDDKYFGICVVMSTMPGLPMFGHGQIEGFSEKYGMEYKRAYKDEQPDGWLISRHEREIFPLLKKRYLFSEVENFLLYDVFDADGVVNEDVFAYSNRAGDERSLVVFNNKFGDAKGWIKTSAQFLAPDGNLIDKTFDEGLALGFKEKSFTIFRDVITGLEYIHATPDLREKGLFIELGAYRYSVFLDFREVQHSADKPYADLAKSLGGRGVESIEEALLDLSYGEVYHFYWEAINPESLNYLASGWQNGRIKPDVVKTFHKKLSALVEAVRLSKKLSRLPAALLKDAEAEFVAVLNLLSLPTGMQPDNQQMRMLLIWLFTHATSRLMESSKPLSSVDSLSLGKLIIRSATRMEVPANLAESDVHLVKILDTFPQGFGDTNAKKIGSWLKALLADQDVRRFADVNTYQNVVWFGKEKFERLSRWMFVLASVQALKGGKSVSVASPQFKLFETVNKAAADAGYQLDAFLALLTSAKTSATKAKAATAKVSKAKTASTEKPVEKKTVAKKAVVKKVEAKKAATKKGVTKAKAAKAKPTSIKKLAAKKVQSKKKRNS